MSRGPMRVIEGSVNEAQKRRFKRRNTKSVLWKLKDEDFKKEQSPVSNATQGSSKIPQVPIWHLGGSANWSPRSKNLTYCICFKEIIHFNHVVDFVGIKLFIVSSDYLFNICKICNDVSSSSPDTVHLCFLSFFDYSCKGFRPHPFDIVTMAAA